MRSRGTQRFWRLYADMPDDARRLAVKAYHLWRENPVHPALRFRPLQGRPDRFTVRIGDHYRALGVLAGDTKSVTKSVTADDFKVGDSRRLLVAVPQSR